MKKISYLFFISFAFILTSCSSDDDSPEASVDNKITYDGKEVVISSGFIEDFGTDEGYYNYDFTVIGTLDGEPYSFYAELYSPITDGNFTPGSFTYVEIESETPPEYFYSYAYLIIGSTEVEVVDGTILVSGSGTDYKISGTLTLENDKTLKVGYSGTFAIIDETEE